MSYMIKEKRYYPTFTNTETEVYYVYYIADIPTPDNSFNPSDFLLKKKG